MKVSLINPSPNEDISETIKGKASWPPLGILYLASVLKRNNYDVSVLDMPAKGYSIEDTVRWVEHEDPDVLGFSTHSMTGRCAASISDRVKEWNPNVLNVFGSFYATFNADRILRKYPSVDIVVRGEGEETILELVKSVDKGSPLEKVAGLNYREKKLVKRTPDRPLIEDVDSIPFPDRTLLEEEYHSTISGVSIAIKKFTSVLHSRGCVHNCKFCCCNQFSRGRWRDRSIDNTVEELSMLQDEGYQQFIFVDDTFTLNPNKTIKLCRNMRKEGIDMEWICEGRVDSGSHEMFREMVRTGCKIMYFGIESANQRILDYYDKKITPQQTEDAVRKARRAGIDLIVGTFILGGPDETREEIQNTLDFAQKLPMDIPQFNILGAHPGMQIWTEMKQKGYIDEEEHWETGIDVSKICPTSVPYDEIKAMIKKSVYKYSRRPSFILTQIGRILKSSYRRGVVMNNLGNIDDFLQAIREPV
jgi:anaerobic magnesium-protoporphyrin IX monomethyl ester cyclase